jgi:hypothetical protein
MTYLIDVNDFVNQRSILKALPHVLAPLLWVSALLGSQPVDVDRHLDTCVENDQDYWNM